MDIKLHYTESGTGFPLILLHGNGESGEYFHFQKEYFCRYFRVIVPDTRGHGGSPRGNAPFTIAQFARDLYDFMEEQGIKKAHILGFSDGGNIAIAFALAYPEYVESLILNGANMNPRGVKRFYQIPIEIGYKIASRAAKKHPDAVKNAELLSLMVNEPDFSAEELSKIKAKTLVIAGSRDMIKTAHTRLIAESIPKSELKIIRGSHFIAEKNPQDFNRAAAEFLGVPTGETKGE